MRLQNFTPLRIRLALGVKVVLFDVVASLAFGMNESQSVMQSVLNND